MAVVTENNANTRALAPPTLRAGAHDAWQGLHGCATSIALAHAAQARDGLTVAVVADEHRAYRLEEELRFFSDENLAVRHFPDWETLPYDVFSPHQDIISQRIATLYQLPQLKRGILVVPISTALHRLAPKNFLLGSSLVLDVGQKLDVEQMRTRLEAAGYRCVDTVYEHGEFAVRGALIDLYPMGSDHPLRIDLFVSNLAISLLFAVLFAVLVEAEEVLHLLGRAAAEGAAILAACAVESGEILLELVVEGHAGAPCR